jgi:hypothetical protein
VNKKSQCESGTNITMEARIEAASDAPVSTVATAMLFGSITFATVALATRTWLIGDSRALLAAMKPRAQPLNVQSFTSIYTLLHHFTVFGLILFFAYICENHPLFPHDEKSYDRDHFFFMIALLFLFSFYTVHKNESVKAPQEKASAKFGDKLDALSNKPKEPVETASDDETMSSFGMGTIQTTGTFIRASGTKDCNDILNRYPKVV